jgi:hypothetical protein
MVNVYAEVLTRTIKRVRVVGIVELVWRAGSVDSVRFAGYVENASRPRCRI